VVDAAPGVVRWGSLLLQVAGDHLPADPGAPVTLGIRPEEVEVGQAVGQPVGQSSTLDSRNGALARVAEAEFLGPIYRLRLRLPADAPEAEATTLYADLAVPAALGVDQRVRLEAQVGAVLPVALPPERLRLFAAGPPGRP